MRKSFYSELCYNHIVKILADAMDNPYFHLLRTAWQHCGPRKKAFLFTYLVFILTNAIHLLQPLVVAQIMNTIQLGGEDAFTRVIPWVLLLPGLDIVFWLFHGPARVSERKSAFIIAQNYTQQMFQRVTDLPLKWHRAHHSGETYDKVDKARRALFQFSDSNYHYVETVATMTIAFIAILSFIPLYGSLMILIGLVIILVMRKFDRVIIRNQTHINKQENYVSAGLFDYISNITTVITLRLQSLAKTEVSRRIRAIFKKFTDNVKVNEWKWFWTSMVIKLGMISLLLIYIYQQVSMGEAILVGSIVALYQYLENMNRAFFNVAWQWEEIIFRSTNLKSAETIVEAHEKYERRHRRIRMPKNWQSIEVKGIQFQYEDEEHHIHHLRQVNIRLEPGKKIALVGKSGSGKSTLMKLLRGLDQPKQAQVSIDGTAYKSLKVLAGSTTLFPQEPEIFENTIEYNITAGIKHNKEDVVSAMKIAAFAPVIKRLPRGIKTDIKEKGVNLSGGEKQRLALARGIFAAHDSSILLLDEPTSSVDPTNEINIYRRMFRHFKDRCIISSVHRLHLLPSFDYIYVLEKGKIVEEGSFDTLKNRPGGTLNKAWKAYNKHSKSKERTL